MALEFLTPAELVQLRDDLQSLVTDPQVGGSVIYQSFMSRGTFDPNNGKITQNFAGTWINTYKRLLTESEIDPTAGRYQLGDYIYYAPMTQIILPKKDDRLIDGVHTRYVLEYSTDSIAIFHAIVVRNV